MVVKPTESETKKEDAKDKDAKKEEMSEEDQKLEEEINLLVERLSESDESLHRAALESLRSLIRASTTSMTSVPKPLKFMRPHFDKMLDIYDNIGDVETKKFCADVISALAMTAEEGRNCLKYRLLGQSEPIGDWGHEYVRHLSTELMAEWKAAADDGAEKATEMLALAREIVAHDMKHNAEAEACDLLMELERLDLLKEFVDEAEHARVCLYLMS